MTDAPLILAPYGTPVQDLVPMDGLRRTDVAPGLRMSSGLHTDLVLMVVEDTGDRICWPCCLVGLVDQEQRSLAVVIHDGAGVPGEAELSIWPSNTLPLTRRILRLIGERLFLTCGLSAVTVRAPCEADTLHWTLGRLGFFASGRDDRPGAASRMIFTLTADVALRRLFPRGVVSLDKVN